MDDDRGRPGWPPAVDTEEAARLAKDVQDLGFEAARTVVDRFVETYGQFYATVVDQAAADGERDGVGTAGAYGIER